MACHLAAQKRARYTSELLAVRVITMEKEVKLTGVAQLLTGQVTRCFILYMDRSVKCSMVCEKVGIFLWIA